MTKRHCKNCNKDFDLSDGNHWRLNAQGNWICIPSARAANRRSYKKHGYNIEYSRSYALSHRAQRAQYQKQYRARYPEKVKEYAKKAYAERKENMYARYAINEMVRRGAINKKSKCEHCHSAERLDAHHPDYSKPLEVIWLCRPCHMKIHRGSI